MTDVPSGPSHTQHEDVPWTIQIPDHPTRRDSPEYVASRKKMNKLASSTVDQPYGPPPYQDHHGGGLWLKDEGGWFLVRSIAGVEWSAQFCADPAKVDGLRRIAQRLYARFPEAVDELGIRDLLDTPITDAAGIAQWTDSICNASVPLPAARHVGMLPGASTGGIHHYPTPIADIDLIRRDDFQLWVETANQGIAAVVPMAPRGSGDGRTRLLLAAVRSPAEAISPIAAVVGPLLGGPTTSGADSGGGSGRLAGEVVSTPAERRARRRVHVTEAQTILAPDHPLSRQAFEQQR